MFDIIIGSVQIKRLTVTSEWGKKDEKNKNNQFNLILSTGRNESQNKRYQNKIFMKT